MAARYADNVHYGSFSQAPETCFVGGFHFHLDFLTDTGIPYIMIDDEFEWDDKKATSNAEKHGVTFEQARMVFRDPFAIELLDDREDYNEDRYILLGIATTNLLVVVYTERSDKNRIISARRAEPNERQFYHEQNQ